MVRHRDRVFTVQLPGRVYTVLPPGRVYTVLPPGRVYTVLPLVHRVVFKLTMTGKLTLIPT